MPDGVPASAEYRSTKRRRLDDSAGEDVSRPSGTYDQWDNDRSSTLGTQSYAGGQPASAYSNPAGAASSALNTTDSWRPTSTSSYPDLASYQQQPYFYAPSGQAAYNESWAPAPVGAYTNTSSTTSYSLRPPSTTVTMPFFPGQAANATNGEKVEANESTNADLSYVDMDKATQLAEYSAPSATATRAQQEAAKSSAYYFDDASMKMKIQSLPILDNLV